jgi:predicted GNAT family acetyltransferase
VTCAHPLDRPVWASLTTHHEPFAAGGPLARRYRAEYNVFAGQADESPEALAALGALVGPGEQVCIAQATPVTVPAGLRVHKSLQGVQLTAPAALGVPEGAEPLLVLTERDAPEMFALAQLTEPGPFAPRTHALGRFLGIRIDGRLVAMAGERFRWPGYTEVSAVCTHPEFRGRGFARRLTAAVTAAIHQRGERAFLQAWKTNTPAITLYQSLGFEIRAEMNVRVLVRATSD